MPSEKEINRQKDQIIEIGTKARAARLIASKDGNLSIRIANKKEPSPEDPLSYSLLVTPSGVYKEDLKRDHIVLVGPEGKPIDETRVPTSDLAIHVAMYEATNQEAAGILHVHGHFANQLALIYENTEFEHPLGDKLIAGGYAISDDARLGRVAITRNPMGKDYQKRVIEYAVQFIPGCDVLLVPTQGSYILSRDTNHPLRDCLDKALHLERLARDIVETQRMITVVKILQEGTSIFRENGLVYDGLQSFQRDLKKCKGLTVGEMPGYDQARAMRG